MTMSTKKPKLGRGLDALLGNAIESAASAKDDLKHVPVDLLQRGKYQPRTHMGEAAL
jgi:ParB family chromosome partitioning protein